MTLLLACVTGAGDGELPPADSADFQAWVEPELGLSCAHSSCHGVARPLEVYAVFYHRADPGDLATDTPLSAAEHQANFDRARAFLVPEDPAASPLLRKPLAPDAGGVPHGDGLVVYPTEEEPGWQALAAWAGLR